MRENFDFSLKQVLKYEGGYSNHPSDPGGATMRGVTQATFNAWLRSKGKPQRSVRSITNDEISAIYRRDYWDAVRGDDLPPGVDFAVFDFAVNSGVSRAAKYLQKIVGTARDGVIGSHTLAAVAESKKDVAAQLCANRLAFLKALPTWRTFGKGWGARVTSVAKLANSMQARKAA